jgi:hypothetical protein
MSIEAMGSEFMRKYGVKTVKRKHKKRRTTSQGWVNESERHQMASYGIKTGRKQREYTPKQTFRSAPLIKAGLGLTIAGVGATARFIAKRREEQAKRKAEEEAEKKRKEEYYQGEIRKPTDVISVVKEKIPFAKTVEQKVAEENYFQAQQHAKQNRLDEINKNTERIKLNQTTLNEKPKSNLGQLAISTPRGEEKPQGFFRKRW